MTDGPPLRKGSARRLVRDCITAHILWPCVGTAPRPPPRDAWGAPAAGSPCQPLLVLPLSDNNHSQDPCVHKGLAQRSRQMASGGVVSAALELLLLY